MRSIHISEFNPKGLKLALVVNLTLLFLWAGVSYASGIDLYGYPIKSTPYDHKSALAEVLRGPYQPPVSVPAESIDRVFWRARRFTYGEEKKGDHWQFPEETEKRQTGDCEDKALWLYAHLRAAGYKNLILAVGKYRSIDAGFHVWLMRVDDNGNAFILDPTIQNRVWPLKSFERGFYQPFFLFDDKQRYRGFLNPPLVF